MLGVASMDTGNNCNAERPKISKFTERNSGSIIGIQKLSHRGKTTKVCVFIAIYFVMTLIELFFQFFNVDITILSAISDI